MNILSQRDYLMLLNMTLGVGAVTYRKLVQVFGSAEAAVHAPESRLREVPGLPKKVAKRISTCLETVELEAEYSDMQRFGVSVVTVEEDAYPSMLKEIYDSPLVIYYRGDIEAMSAPMIGLVGARRCTQYGRASAERLARDLARSGITVVSGLARGIDGAAHTGALAGKGRTVAVLGHGLGTIYPKEHGDLAMQVIEQGCLVSEFPMNVGPRPEHFPRRNRIISGMSRGVVVIEAAKRSGSLITAHWAADQGREVMAWPGKCDSPMSEGPHLLVRDGATLVASAVDVLESCAIGGMMASTEAKDSAEAERLDRLNRNERKIYDLLSDEEQHIDDIIQKSSLPVSTVSATLLMLEIYKMISQMPGKLYVRNNL